MPSLWDTNKSPNIALERSSFTSLILSFEEEGKRERGEGRERKSDGEVEKRERKRKKRERGKKRGRMEERKTIKFNKFSRLSHTHTLKAHNNNDYNNNFNNNVNDCVREARGRVSH